MENIFLKFNINKNLYETKNYKKNEIVFSEGEKCLEIGFILSGNLSIVTPTFDENEYEINNLTQFMFYGTFIIFSENNKFLGTGIAKQNTSIITISKYNLFIAFKNQDFLNAFLSITSNIALKFQTKVKLLSQKSIRNRIMFLLLDNYKKNNQKTLVIKNKNSLSNYLNIPRPSLSRELINLKKDGFIEYNRNYITLLIIPKYY